MSSANLRAKAIDQMSTHSGRAPDEELFWRHGVCQGHGVVKAT